MAAAACSRSEPAAPPVATPTVTVNKPRAAIGSPLRITYKFDVAPGARLERDYLVFLHVIDPDGETLWQDDHHPAVPTSQWKPGQTVEYTRTIFVPNYPYIGDTTLRVGLYDPQSGERAVLDAPDAGQREYTVGTLNLLPQADNIFLIYKDGWHPAEVDSTNPLVEWQWTEKAATLSFRNPKKDATFYIESDARTDLFSPPQQVTLSVGGQPIGTFAADVEDADPADVPDHRRPVRRRRHGRDDHRGRPDLLGDRRLPRTRDPGLPRLRRADVVRSVCDRYARRIPWGP